MYNKTQLKKEGKKLILIHLFLEYISDDLLIILITPIVADKNTKTPVT